MENKNITKEVGKGYEQFREEIRGLTNIRRKIANSSTFRSVQMETKLAITIYYYITKT